MVKILKYDLNFRSNYGNFICYYISPARMCKEIGGIYITKNLLNTMAGKFEGIEYGEYPKSVSLEIKFSENEITNSKFIEKTRKGIFQNKNLTIKTNIGKDLSEYYCVMHLHSPYQSYFKFNDFSNINGLYVLKSELNFIQLKKIFLVVSINLFNY